MARESPSRQRHTDRAAGQAPVLSLPKGGGAARTLGETFAANPVTGTASMTVPLPLSASRFGPQLTLGYDSGSGNGPFGLGWTLALASISRRTEKGRPQYRDEDESDVFLLSGSEDLVPCLRVDGTFDEAIRDGYNVRKYRPRVEGLFARIERWTRASDGDTYWRSISKENITTIYGRESSSRIADPADPSRVFTWLICQSYDDKGNAIVYEHVPEDSAHVDVAQAHERSRTELTRSANRYLKRIKYGNRIANRDANWVATDPATLSDWMFEVVFDYGEVLYESLGADAEDREFVRATLSAPGAGSWPVRQDPFSSYRSGFEVRTYRLCRRVLMFHHFPQELGLADYLVRSMELAYEEHPTLSFVTSIAHAGYVHSPLPAHPDRYLMKRMPALQFEYSQVPTPAQLAAQPVHDVDADSVANLPYGADGSAYRWVDLDGDGLSGILSEQAEGWFYKRNLSANNQVEENGTTRTAARFGPLELVSTRPGPDLGVGDVQLIDLAGDGQVDLVVMDAARQGFYERTAEEGWAPFQPFTSFANFDTRDPNLRFVDLDGDGHSDAVITENEVLTWYPSLGEAGFGPARRVRTPLDEEDGPRVVFDDGTESIYLADFTGDGRTDFVRIRNGEVCYWPWLGERLGARVVMDGGPVFDLPERFDPKRIRLADIDGSGTTDIIYLGAERIDVYRNQSGNSWSASHPLSTFPATDNLSSVSAIDLLGNGTACLVWSSPLPGDTARPMRYIDLMGGQKPHLLIRTLNNLGAETVAQYSSSAKFCSDDRLAGKPWLSRLPFPVHVVERLETYDRGSGNRFVSRFAYHHGHYDGVEREFRGFGMVEQWDTEEIGSVAPEDESSGGTNLDAASFVPPVHTKSWFHTGIYVGRDRISNHFAGLLDGDDLGEYYRPPGSADVDASAFLLDDTVLPGGLTAEEEFEACRALKGSMLRQEIYGLDGGSRAAHPYTVVEQNFTIELVQPRGANRNAVFFTHAREARTCHYERDPAHPRLGHTLTLDVDDYGNVLKSVAIGYGRTTPELTDGRDRQRQARTLITYTDSRVTNAVDEPDAHRAPLPSDVRTYELHADPESAGYTPSGEGGFFTAGDFVETVGGSVQLIESGAGEIPYEGSLSADRTRRLIEHVRTLHRRNDLSGLLAPGELESLALPGATFRLAFTPGLLATTYVRALPPAAAESLVPDPSEVLGGQGGDRGGYADLDADGRWWVPSGGVFFSAAVDVADPAQTAAAELAEARQHFFRSRGFADAFGRVSTATYDAHDLLVVRTEDAVQNVVTAIHDYRVLQARSITDANGNRSEAAFDALGMVVGTAIMGKASGPLEGDSLATFAADLSPHQITEYFDSSDPRPLAVVHLGTATTRIVYDLNRVPACAATIARETHVSDLGEGEQPRVKLSFVYSDGLGRQSQTKIEAEPGPLDADDTAAPILDPRWVGSGATIYNNKGKPVRQYEPFFSPTHAYGIEQHGVSRTLFYDPAERLVATLFPDHSWNKVVFDAWRQGTYDVNDTVLNADGSTDPRDDPDVGGFFSRQPDDDYRPTWYEQRIGLPASHPQHAAAEKASVHRQTPVVAHYDALGRPFVTFVRNRFVQDAVTVEEEHAARVDLDIEGNARELRDGVVQNGDSAGRVVMRYGYDMLGTRIHQASMEAGEGWTLNDAAGKPIRTWDGRGHDGRTEYDAMRRPLRRFVRGVDPARSDARTLGANALFERIEYGEDQPDDGARNLRGRVFRTSDGAGTITTDAYDFKGNLVRSSRRLAQDYKALPNWLGAVALEDAQETTSTYDALNRVSSHVLPDGTVVRPRYNAASLLDTLQVHIGGAPQATAFVTNVDYNARGQRTLIEFASGAATRYQYDPHAFRLVRLLTSRPPGQNGQTSAIFASPGTVQDLRYTHDPTGNITRIHDASLLAVFHGNEQVEPVGDYTYDAIYRLIEATGREHIGQTTFGGSGATFRDYPFLGIAAGANDLQALRNYRERYQYDAAGNIVLWTHDAAQAQWTRVCAYAEPSPLEPGKQSNRLSSTATGNTVEAYAYDAQGNMTAMPHLPLMRWCFAKHLQAAAAQSVDAGTPETTYYVYDAAGQRVRKVTERQNGTRKSERVYLGALEILRQFAADGATVTLQKGTVHVLDGERRLASIESTTVEDGTPLANPAVRQRYQFANHLGSAGLELDEQAALISYEEYHPYGTSAYQVAAAGAEARRYRYTGRERDAETGFGYHRARYYAPWLGRWTSTDPAHLADALNLYQYCVSNPIVLQDIRGLQACDPELASCDAAAEPEPIVNSLDPYDPRNHPNPLSVIDRDTLNTAFRESLQLKRDESPPVDPESPESMVHLRETALLNDAIKGEIALEQEQREARERALRDPIAEANGAGDKLGEPGKVVVEAIAGGAVIRGGAMLGRFLAQRAELYAISRGFYSSRAVVGAEVQWGARTTGAGVTISGEVRSRGTAWALDEFGRPGRFLRGDAFDINYFGNNLGRTFPTIDVAARLDLLPQAPLIRSSKSLNTSLPSYQTPGKVYERVMIDADKLGHFTSRTWQGVTVTATEDTLRVLQVAVPGRISDQASAELFQATIDAAARYGVRVDLFKVY